MAVVVALAAVALAVVVKLAAVVAFAAGPATPPPPRVEFAGAQTAVALCHSHARAPARPTVASHSAPRLMAAHSVARLDVFAAPVAAVILSG